LVASSKYPYDPKTLNALAINLHGHRMGVINRISGDRYLFSFEDAYIEDANRPTLSLSFKGQAGGLVIPTRAVTGRLPAFFSNLLPEGHLREYLASQAAVQSHREFFLLAALGADLPGALTITPMEPPTEASSESADNHPARERFQEGAAFRCRWLMDRQVAIEPICFGARERIYDAGSCPSGRH
jgi:serine/threonine-protein kinase HipA